MCVNLTKNLINQLVGVGIQWFSTTKCCDITNFVRIRSDKSHWWYDFCNSIWDLILTKFVISQHLVVENHWIPTPTNWFIRFLVKYHYIWCKIPNHMYFKVERYIHIYQDYLFIYTLKDIYTFIKILYVIYDRSLDPWLRA